jgi:hypothetical protein
MQVGDLVKVKYPNPTSNHPHIGVVLEFLQWGVVTSKFARVCLMDGHRATYRIDNLEVMSCK